jgi:hypothetical protein
MIRINRNPNPPTSLLRPEIIQYLHDLQAYKSLLEDFQNGHSEAEPIAPTKPGSYRSMDLLDAFEDQFFAKCYLTEEKFDDGAELEVDHFVTQNEADHLRYDWHNLFPISPLANKMRPKSTPFGGYLNPCSDDVEAEIVYLFVPLAEIFSFEARNPSNSKAVNTAKLLDHLHNGDQITRRSVLGLQKAITKKCLEIGEIFAAYSNPRDDQEKGEAAAKLRKYFSRTSAFTMLMRNSPTGQRLKEFHQD